LKPGAGESLAAIQRIADRNVKEFGLLSEEVCENHSRSH